MWKPGDITLVLHPDLPRRVNSKFNNDHFALRWFRQREGERAKEIEREREIERGEGGEGWRDKTDRRTDRDRDRQTDRQQTENLKTRITFTVCVFSSQPLPILQNLSLIHI